MPIMSSRVSQKWGISWPPIYAISMLESAITPKVFGDQKLVERISSTSVHMKHASLSSYTEVRIQGYCRGQQHMHIRGQQRIRKLITFVAMTKLNLNRKISSMKNCTSDSLHCYHCFSFGKVAKDLDWPSSLFSNSLLYQAIKKDYYFL